MKYQFKIKDKNLRHLLVVEDLISHPDRHLLLTITKFAIYLLVVVVLLRLSFDLSFDFAVELVGVVLILLSLVFTLFSLEFFFRFYYRDNLEGSVDGGRILFGSKEKDLTKALFRSELGKSLSLRLGIDRKEFLSIFSGRTDIPLFNLSPVDKKFSTKGLILTIYDQDKLLEDTFRERGITRKELGATLDWILLSKVLNMKEEAFWSKKSLAKIKAVASDWAYGLVPTLDKYKTDFEDSLPIPIEIDFTKKITAQIINTLSKQQMANPLLVTDTDVGLDIIVSDFLESLPMKKSLKRVKNKKVISLDFYRLISDTKEKTIFEGQFLKLLEEVSSAGNIILFIKDLPEFIKSAKGISSDVASLIEPFLDSKLQIVATSSTSGYHNLISKDDSISKKFDPVLIKEPSQMDSLTLLMLFAMKIERERDILFTYEALFEIANGVTRYYSSYLMPDSAFDLLDQVVSAYPDQNIDRKKVLDFIQTETNIPLGEMTADEKEKFNNLESTLHKRVVGQNGAVRAVSSAMKRARLNLTNPKRPLGSFLFVGPTGVGKTETAKALAEAFFGDEKYILRLDMTEFKEEGSLGRLIGSFEWGSNGILSNIIKENPYGVMLLDEFEKASSDVHDLFLQIFDEGFFSDREGKKINAKNIIFIATSNAVSDMIFDFVEKGEDLQNEKNKIIREMIDRTIFKPELINRFDGVILFEPLKQNELKQIAKIMLDKLHDRLKERGIELVINEYLINFVATKGYNPKFGARPMQRVIQDKVEHSVAEKILNGEIKEGSTLEFNEGDIV